MTSPIPMSSPDIGDDEVAAVVNVLRSGVLALGPNAREFEQAVAEYVGVRHAVAVNSGTAALHLAVRALGLGPGDEVVLPSFTFAASVNAFLYERVTPVFADIDDLTYCLDPDDASERVGPRCRAVLGIDVFGHPAPWDAVLRLADARGLAVVDDACEALGSEFDGRRVGSFGDAATFAFYPNKQLTTGEGGMLVTDRDDIASMARSLSNQGRGGGGAWLVHEELGYNYRLDELSAALGRVQMGRVEEFVEKRARVAEGYSKRLAGRDWVRTQVVAPGVRMSWFVYVVTLARGIARDEVIERLATRGIPARAYFEPVHSQPYMRKLFPDALWELPVTDDIAGRTLALPFHNNLADDEVERVVGELVWAVEGT